MLPFFCLLIFPGTVAHRVYWKPSCSMHSLQHGACFCSCITVSSFWPFWDQWDGEHQGYCVELNRVAWSNAALSIAIDFWMLFIPLSQLIFLKLSWRKKVSDICACMPSLRVAIVRLLPGSRTHPNDHISLMRTKGHASQGIQAIRVAALQLHMRGRI